MNQKTINRGIGMLISILTLNYSLYTLFERRSTIGEIEAQMAELQKSHPHGGVGYAYEHDYFLYAFLLITFFSGLSLIYINTKETEQVR